jgi:transglutaminase-like putative cysteine protease
VYIRYGYIVEIETEAEAEIGVRLDIHPEQRGDISQPDVMTARARRGGAPVDCSAMETDGHGNIRRRIRAPAGGIQLEGEGVLFHAGFADLRPSGTGAVAPAELPAETLPFLLASPACDTAALTDQAWSLFRHIPAGFERVDAICEYVHQKLRFAEDEPLSRRTASEALQAGAGSIRDFAHAAIAFCRAMEIPARYCAGYLPGSGEKPGRCEGGFCAWFEAYLDGWWTFDPWHGDARIGRILVARGFDAIDAPLIEAPTGARVLRLHCYADPIAGPRYPATAQDRDEHWQARSARTGT